MHTPGEFCVLTLYLLIEVGEPLLKRMTDYSSRGSYGIRSLCDNARKKARGRDRRRRRVIKKKEVGPGEAMFTIDKTRGSSEELD
ncbi:hypothetical protein EVAR_71689_1 [Eumeta japonica]|uniref:Uncharacterized protein n=1 Tax=Eumeta variegata TaxID=151549 RepID=A0A4C1SBQ0_EUMVA|nr:hypothetical protein EVAR_71689_1 [Eumeta japonica]